MRTKEIIGLSEQVQFPTYNRFPLALVRGRGVYVWDAEGNRYIDCVGSLGAAGLGHCHPRVTRAIAKQVRKLIHTTNLFYNENQAKLGEQLTELSGMEKVFFCNSGAEANEAAFKLARKFAITTKGPACYEILSVTGSFHGRTLACIAASGQDKLKAGFGPQVEGFKSVAWNDLPAMERAISDKTAAVILEPILGEGGVLIPDANYLKRVRELCTTKGVLLILDEVQVGIGRTGQLFAFQHSGILPDMLTLAKSLAGGVPIGAMLARGACASALVAGDHASTFGGSPLISAAGRAALDAILKDGLIGNAHKMGNYFLNGLKELKKRETHIHEVRGLGLILAAELDEPARPVALKCIAKGLLVGLAQEKTLRFLPPLVITKKEIDRVLKILDEVLSS